MNYYFQPNWLQADVFGTAISREENVYVLLARMYKMDE
jgi:hypothetical protein